jgi:GNAT superfamily N-acetyltransferase
MIFDSDSRADSGAAFLDRLGGKKSLVARKSRLAVADLDRSLMTAWIDASRETSDAFEILEWTDRVPDEHLEAFAALQDVMNSAPFEDLHFEPFVLTPEQLRAYEASRLARGMRSWCVVARHRDSGEFAGFTDMVQTAEDPTIVHQGGTGVWHKYRRKGLGRRLKAECALWVLRDAPDAKWFETENAGSNQAMLAINVAMGYTPYKEITAWQFDVAALLSRTAIHPAGQEGSRVIR